MIQSGYYPGIFLEVPSKITNNLSGYLVSRLRVEFKRLPNIRLTRCHCASTPSYEDRTLLWVHSLYISRWDFWPCVASELWLTGRRATEHKVFNRGIISRKKKKHEHIRGPFSHVAPSLVFIRRTHAPFYNTLFSLALSRTIILCLGAKF
jgi:hypothetical protein